MLFEGSVQSSSFWVEVLLGGLIPALLFSFRSLRQRPRVLFWSAVMVVIFGIVLNRLNVSMVGLWPFTGYIYFPSWMEILITVTIVSFGVLAFGVISKNLPVFPEHAHE